MDFEFDWDPAKDEVNERKHKISFSDAIAVFDDPQHVKEDATRPEHGERRTMAIGRIGMLIWVVVYTDRPGRRRIISARRASSRERERYRKSAETS